MTGSQRSLMVMHGEDHAFLELVVIRMAYEEDKKGE